MIAPEWAAPANVRALMTTRGAGDVASPAGRAALRACVPAEPAWLKQVHGATVVEADEWSERPQADASFTRRRGVVCAVMAADCMPVLFADAEGTVVGAAHAGWRGLCAGVLEATVAAMGVDGARVHAWLGPAIGPRVYEVGADVRDAFVAGDPRAVGAFSPNRPGHWLLDLYAVARQRLQGLGVRSVCGGGFCTYSEPDRFFSYRRDRATGRMAALVWLA